MTTQDDARTICIVDDDDAVRDSLKVLLESYGMQVRDFASPADFLRGSAARECRCLVVDLHMPAMNGLELLETLRAREVNVPAVMVTGNADPNLALRLKNAGLSALLIKPVADDELLDHIALACASPLH
ncbi:MAG: response regulator transcription factor [Rhizomicrobium sp.]